MIAPTVLGDFQVTCSGDCERPVALIVETLLHAERLERKHFSEYHPQETPSCEQVAASTTLPDSTLPPLMLDLGAAASAYIKNPHRAAAAVWAALIGVNVNDVMRLNEVAEAARESRALGYIPPM